MATHLAGSVVLLAIAALPLWPHSRAWGWAPAGGLALLALLLGLLHHGNVI